MLKLRALLLTTGMFVLAGGLVGQDAKKDKDAPVAKKDTPKDTPPAKKGQMPPGWSKIGLTDDQKKKVQAIDAKHDEEIDKLTAKIKELKEAKRKEQLEVLTAEQKKRLEDNIKKAAGTDK